jgi:hypothetical protein
MSHTIVAIENIVTGLAVLYEVRTFGEERIFEVDTDCSLSGVS